jgi:hypothetical protein
MKPEPIVCTLTPEQLREKRDDLLPGLVKRADKVSNLSNGVRLRFTPAPGLLADLARVVDEERTCCRFLRFHIAVEPGGGPITFDVTGPPGTREMLRAL